MLQLQQVKSQPLTLEGSGLALAPTLVWRLVHYDEKTVPQALGCCPSTSSWEMGDYWSIPQLF